MGNLPAVMPPAGNLTMLDTPATLHLSAQEITRALEIKAAVQAQSDLTPVSDFAYVIYSLCAEEEAIDQILQRIRMMEAFKKEYSIHDTVEEGIELLTRLQQMQPGYLLSIEYLSFQGNFLTVLHPASLFMSTLRTYEEHRVMLGALYYICTCRTCQIAATRTGYSLLVECMGTTLQNIDGPFLEKLMHELFRWYPQKQKEMYLLNSPSAINFAVGLWRRYMKPNMKRALHLGYQVPGLEGQPIDVLYKTPTPEIAHQNMLARARLFLEIRYKNEREFSLPTSTD